MFNREELYKELKSVVESSKATYRRYDLVSYCIGRYGCVDAILYDVINELFRNELIEA